MHVGRLNYCLLSEFWLTIVRDVKSWYIRMSLLTGAFFSQCPRLEEVTSSLTGVLCGKTFSASLHQDDKLVKVLLEELLAHYFSADRPGYHPEDIKYFLQLINAQLHWQLQVTTTKEASLSVVSLKNIYITMQECSGKL